MKRRYHFSRQLAQLRHLGKQLIKLKANSQRIPHTLLRKFRKRFAALSTKIGQPRLQRLIGTTALVLGMGFSAQAQTFLPPVESPFGLDTSAIAEGYYNYPAFADLDNDGDLDLLTVLANDEQTPGGNDAASNFVYYENIGTAEAPQFAAPQENPFGLASPNASLMPLEIIDVDEDGDLDIVASGFRDTVMGNYSYEVADFFVLINEGDANNPAFAEPVTDIIDPSTSAGDEDEILYFGFGDLDEDGDLDLLASTYAASGDDFVALYYENTAAQGIELAVPQSDPFGLQINGLADYLFFDQLADVDGDGDLDLIAVGTSYDYDTELYAGNVVLFENTGDNQNPAFGPGQTAPFGLPAFLSEVDFPRISFVDIDNDGDLDLFAISEFNILYFENIMTSSVAEVDDQLAVTLSPNPTNGIVNVNTDEAIARVEVSNTFGQQLLSMNGPQNQINVGSLPNGIYLVKITTTDQRFRVLRVRKQ